MANFISTLKSSDNFFIGQLEEQPGGTIKKVKAYWNGRHFGVFSAGFLPCHLGGKGETRCAVIIPLPVSERPEEGILRLEEEDGKRHFEVNLKLQQPTHANGLTGLEILRLQKTPISKLQYASMTAGAFQITGFAQTAFSSDMGLSFADRLSITAKVPSGVHATVDPFVPSSGHNDVFWYYPAAEYCGLLVNIDLGASVCNKSEIEICLDLGKSPAENLPYTTWVPLDLKRYMNYPNSDRMQRVQAYDNAVSVSINGYSDARRMREIFGMHGLSLYNKDILDWGCGHGRVLRHFMMDGDLGRIAGVDIDPDNVGWARTALRNRDLHVGPLMPPTEFEDNSFDGVYGISVMTHLDPDIQSAWLAELRRILKPGGLALLTFAGAGSVAFGSRFFSPTWIDEWLSEGVNATAYESFDSVVGKKDYYRNVFMTNAYMHNLWSRHLQIEAVYDNMFGYQSLAVLRK